MDFNLVKKGNNIYEIEKSGLMKVPARFFTSESLLNLIKQDKTIEQIKRVSMLPGIEMAALCMPDAHQGYGFPIGGVAALDFYNGGISPGGIGYDENCGVRLMKTPLFYSDISDKKKFEELLSLIFDLVPLGVGGEQKAEYRLSYDELDDVLKNGVLWSIKKGYGIEEDSVFCEEHGVMSSADPSKVSLRAKKRGRRQLGSLGAGNHFIEIQRVDEVFNSLVSDKFGLKKDQIVVMIHSGSRGLGHQVCTDYLNLIEKEYPDIVESLPDKELMYAPSGSKLADDFFGAMSAAANFAWANRQMIMHNVRLAFEKVYSIKYADMKLLYDVTHNIAKIEEFEINGVLRKFYVHRKGATRSFPKYHPDIPKEYFNVGQPVIIPGSMGTSSYVLVGDEKSMKLSFGSVAHGAGRKLSRFQAKKEFDYDVVKNDMLDRDILVKSASRNGIVEENYKCYKDVDEVIKVIDDVGLAKKVVKLVPIGVIKG